MYVDWVDTASGTKCVFTNLGVNKLTELKQAGLSNSECARKMGLDVKVVHTKVSHLNLGGMKSSFWDAERIELLKVLWRDGLSCSQIAGRLGCTSRNAVIGKINRLGLSGRVVRARKITTRKPRPKESIRFGRVKSFEPVEVAPLPPEPVKPDKLFSLTAITDREDQEHVKLCRFIYGDPKQAGSGYCGCTAATGSSYCPGHHHMIFTAPPVRVRTKPTCGPKIAVKNIGNPHHTRKMEVVW